MVFSLILLPDLIFVLFTLLRGSSFLLTRRLFSSAHDIEVSSFAWSSLPLVLVAAATTASATCTSSKRKDKDGVPESSSFPDVPSFAGGVKFGIGGQEGFFGDGFSCGLIRSAADVDPNVFGEVFIPKWNVSSGSHLDTAADCREILDGFAPPGFFAEDHGIKDDNFFEEFNYLSAH